MKHFFKGVLVKCRLFPFFIPIYKKVAYGVFGNKSEKSQSVNFYSQLIKKSDLCFDVGANKGDRTEIFLKLGAKVVAIEPQKECVKCLKKRFQKEPNLIIVEKGLADKESEIEMHICEEADGISTFSEKWKTGRFSNHKWNKKKMVPCTTLDVLIKEFGAPVFCKIDVEGFEHQVLKGLSQPIKYLSFEFTKEFFDDTKTCIDYLVSLGYAQFNCSISESMQFLFPTWVTVANISEKLNSIKDNLLWGDIYAKY